jgi:protein-tyrosine phosphatase
VGVIDLHCHLLPGLDDGPATIDESVALARRLAHDGVETVVATPHVSPDYPTAAAAIAAGVADVRAALSGAGVELEVLAGAEISFSMLSELDPGQVAELVLGDGDTLLLESPYNAAAPFLEAAIFEVQLKGFRVLLAHPERSPPFQDSPDRVGALVERGALCCVNGGSMRGRFGKRVHQTALQLFRRGLVHAVASDAHDLRTRPPGLRDAFAALEHDLPGIAAQEAWFTRDAPAALLSGDPLPSAPAPPAARRPRRLLKRLRD